MPSHPRRVPWGRVVGASIPGKDDELLRVTVPSAESPCAKTADALSEEFGELRERWTRLHAARNVLNIAGFALTVLGALSETQEREAPTRRKWPAL